MTQEKLPISIYTSATGEITVDVLYDNNSLWLSEQQMATVFDITRTVVSKHISNIIESGELSEEGVCALFAHTAKDGKTYQVKFYSLDMIISVGYRVNSLKATQFRKRATNILKEYTLTGYAINQNRLGQTGLKALEDTMQFLKQTLKEIPLGEDDAKAITDIIIQYTTTWASLYQYDIGEMDLSGGTQNPENMSITGDILHNELGLLKKQLLTNGTATDLFATEKYAGTLGGIIGNIYQTYDGTPLYPTVESKAAHLLYFVVKDHPFNDGNKRSGAFLFILFLKLYNILYDKKGETKINDRGLTALTLLIAQSDPKHKDLLIQLVTYLIQ